MSPVLNTSSLHEQIPTHKSNPVVSLNSGNFRKRNMEKISERKLTESPQDGDKIVSSFGKLWKFKNKEENYFPTPDDWLEEKRRGDNIGEFWRVHDKLYDLTNFIDKHPGGRDWIKVTQGTDITEAFESSHVVNMNKVESILTKYFIKDATTPRNSPYIFKDNGFYKTLKRRVEPVLKVKIDLCEHGLEKSCFAKSKSVSAAKPSNHEAHLVNTTLALLIRYTHKRVSICPIFK